MGLSVRSRSLAHVWSAATFMGFLWSISWITYSGFPISTWCILLHCKLEKWLLSTNLCQLPQHPHLSAFPELKRVSTSFWIRFQPQAMPLFVWVSLWDHSEGLSMTASFLSFGLFTGPAPSFLYFFLLFLIICLSVGMWPSVQASEEARGMGTRRVMGSHVSPNMGAENQTWVLCKGWGST